MDLELCQRVDGGYPLRRYLGLRPGIGHGIDELGVQVGDLGIILIRQHETADPGLGQHGDKRHPQRPAARYSHGRLHYPSLPLVPEERCLAVEPASSHNTPLNSSSSSSKEVDTVLLLTSSRFPSNTLRDTTILGPSATAM